MLTVTYRLTLSVGGVVLGSVGPTAARLWLKLLASVGPVEMVTADGEVLDDPTPARTSP